MRALWAIALAGCTFQANNAPKDGRAAGHDAPRDGGVTPDATIMTPQLHGVGVGIGTSSVTVTSSGDASAGDVALALAWAGATVTSVTGGAGSMYTQLVSNTADGNCKLYFLRVENAQDVATVTASCASGCGAGIELLLADYTSVSAGAVFEPTEQIQIATSTLASATTTTAHDDDAVVGLVIGHASPSAGSGFTQEQTPGNDSLIEDVVDAKPGTYDATATFTTDNAWCLGLVAVAGATQ